MEQANEATQAAGPRPSVMSLSIRDKASLYASYMAFIDGGGLFIPTTRPVRLGDEARSTSLFGDTRHIWVHAAGDEVCDFNIYKEPIA